VLGELARRLGFDVLGGIDPEQCTDDSLLRGVAAGSRGGYEQIVAGGPHGVSTAPEYGWVHEKVLPGGRWRIAPTSLVARLVAAADLVADPAVAPVRCPGGELVLVPRRRVRSMNSVRYVPLMDVAREPAELRLNPDDAAALGVDDGARVRLKSANGTLDGIARRDPTVRRGVVSCPHGVVDANVARLTSAATDLDPDTGMPRASGVPVILVPTGQDGA
jgi:anaerobic selenocysteine-containing dehydrogenase